MAKIVLIGAGSHTFARNLMTDVLLYPELRDCTISLVDIAQEPLDLITAFAKKLVEQQGFKTKIESTTNRREALAGADFVITTIRVGGGRAEQADREVLTKYGIEWDDTLGPGAIFYASRHIPAILDICHDMEELCPNAWLLNYSNPMAMICWAINDYTKIKNAGLCPNPRNFSRDLARHAGVPLEEITYWVGGINHFSWYLEINWQGKSLYPQLREKFKGPDFYSRPDAGMKRDALGNWVGFDLVQIEILNSFGYFDTGGGHITRYVPYFKRLPEQIEKYKLNRDGFSEGEMSTRRKTEDEELRQQIASNYKFPFSREYRWSIFAANIIHSIETGTPRRVIVNVKNNGLITNLLDGCCVEVSSLVDKEGIHPCFIGDLPAQCAALNRTNINTQELAVRGIVEKDKSKIFQACLVDPLTSSKLSIYEIRQMVDEVFQKEKEYLKGYERQTTR